MRAGAFLIAEGIHTGDQIEPADWAAKPGRYHVDRIERAARPTSLKLAAHLPSRIGSVSSITSPLDAERGEDATRRCQP